MFGFILRCAGLARMKDGRLVSAKEEGVISCTPFLQFCS